AAIIDCYEVLTIEALEAAYQRIKTVKSLRKTDRLKASEGETQMTTGIIVARSSDLTLEQISAEMGRMNSLVPSHYWPDAVAVLSAGIVNYSAHMPGSEQSGDFFLPAEATVKSSPVPSGWIQKVIRPVGEITFNKVASLIIARVAIFQPGVQVPDYNQLIKDMPSHGAVTQTYQFNLANTLVEMTMEQIIAERLPPDTFNIVSGKEKLGSIQYQSWQDGGVFIVRGKFPIDPFFIFLNSVIPGLSAKDLQYFRGPGVQISYVLPVNQRQFLQTLSLFERRSSNISIQRETAKVLMQKIGDEGASSPFVARLMLGVMQIRDAVYDDKTRLYFDKLYGPVLSGLQNARETGQDIAKEWEQHRAKVESGAIVRASGRMVHVSESIDRSQKRDLESFLSTAVRTIKNSLQILASELGVNISFLFQRESTFQTGITTTRAFDPILADYLLATRQWSEPLVFMRNELEHGTIPVPKVSYMLDSSPVRADEPRFNGRPITEFTNEVLDRICCFVEDITVYCLRKKLPRGFEVTELPLADRDLRAPERFHITVTPGGRQAWVLSAHTRSFTET
ncbi:MAG: hypothetical protein KKD53_04335, partial [Proteobacteria bacterium]|nr:hypothetical protein [Pseudomonadota bacterium]